MHTVMEQVDFYNAFFTALAVGIPTIIAYGMILGNKDRDKMYDKEALIRRMSDSYYQAKYKRGMDKYGVTSMLSIMELQNLYYQLYNENKIDRAPWNTSLSGLPDTKVTRFFKEIHKSDIMERFAANEHYQLDVFETFNRLYRPLLNELSMHKMSTFSHWGN